MPSSCDGAGFSRKPRDRMVGVAEHEPVGRRVVDRDEAERADRAGRLVLGDLRGDVDVGQDVAVEHQEALVEADCSSAYFSAPAVPRGSGSTT